VKAAEIATAAVSVEQYCTDTAQSAREIASV